ncbi:MAG: guanosine monophosphate reductase [Candidatus Hodarchaeales archaeon]|jgi:IMP dehydrogenase
MNIDFHGDCALTFDDVLLVPQYCDIHSREHVITKTKLTKNVHIDIPIIAANMDSITESDMMYAMHTLGGIGIMHRFMSLESLRYNILDFLHYFKEEEKVQLIAASIGFNNSFSKVLKLYQSLNVNIVCIDVAHGHCDRMIDTIKRIKDFDSKFEVIAGNVATRDATRDLCEAGADAIKVGIGPGSMCTTRLVTGIGVPQLSAIIDCSDVANQHGVPIIADGGIRNSGDIVKALAAGASSVMVGNLISGTDETPGDLIEDIFNKKYYKQYRGMASDDVMTGWKGKDYHAASEGESRLVERKGSVDVIINKLVAGLRSGMTYCNAKNIDELRKNAIFRIVSANCIIENRPHGL